MPSQQACWTCKARRVPCDGGSPTCQKCVRARRSCQGYEKRLSWPRADDKRRALTCPLLPLVSNPSQDGNFLFINTTRRDVELYNNVDLPMQTRLFHTPSDLWGQPQVGLSNMDLVNHCILKAMLFYNDAYLLLVTFDSDSSQVRDALIRIALASHTASGLALFHALLAFSSLHRSGPNQRAVQLKILALQHLSASAKDGPVSSGEAAPQVAASMLLGAFDILLPSAGSGEWLWYTQGAMDIVQATCLRSHSFESDISHLLNWVYYHDALSHFPIHHWQHNSLAREVHDMKQGRPQDNPSPSLIRYRPAVPSLDPTHAILNLLSEACDTLLDPWDPRSHSEEYQLHLRVLEDRVGNVPVRSTSVISDTDAILPAEIFQIATRIYLARASQSPGETPAYLESLIDMAFSGPIQDCFCPHFFPLFIVACEARTDDRRTAIINLIDRTAKDGRVRNREWLRNMVQSIWVHQDLHSDSDLLVNYVKAMSAVISSSSTVPSFV